MNVINVSDAGNVAQQLPFMNLRKKPKRHGTGGLNMSDYIDRNRLKQGIQEDAMTALQGWDSSLMDLVMLDIDEIPAADVEPVRHGNWNIRLADEMTLCLECSVCGRRVDNIDLHYLLEAGEYGEACRKYPYCHCGSKMDLEDENDEN